MKVAVVGGGAAGILAAIGASEYGHDVVLFEQNEKLGKKIYITGKGRCNVTNACPVDELMKNIVHNPKFLYSAFDAFDNSDIQSLLEEQGCELKVERGNRVFPVSDHSSDVIAALRSKLEQNKVQVRFNVSVKKLLLDDNKVIGIQTGEGKDILFDWVIIATGGKSYQTTGSDGYFLGLLSLLGHEIVKTRPALVTLNSDDRWACELPGLSLKNVSLKLLRNNKKVYEDFGEMLFTHKGISGPIVLSASSFYEPGDWVELDLKPALDDKKLDLRLQRDFAANSNKIFSNALDGLFPKRLIDTIVKLSGIDPDKKVHQITGEERNNLVHLIKHLRVNISGTADFSEAIITRGGVSTKEIDPSTMQSKLFDNLSFAGEMIDVDALTGGFNLQIAWSTGYLAGTRVGW